MNKRARLYNIEVWCDCCGQRFNASRYDAKYCSSSCRSRARRLELKRSRAIKRIKDEIDGALTDCGLELADSLAREIAEYANTYTVKVIGE